MSAPFDPEVVALLREILDDPESTLLRARAAIGKCYARREPPVSPSAPFLTKAEKHLLIGYREAAGRLLWHMCGIQVEKTGIVFAEGQPMSQDEWRGRARRLLDGERPDSIRKDLDFLARCSPDCEEAPAASEMAVVALRLLPCDDLRNWYAVALLFEDQPQSAVRVLQSILTDKPSCTMRSVAFESMGLVYFTLGQFAQARENYQQAYCAQLRPAPVLWWFTTSLQIGDENGAMLAARTLSEQSDDAFLHAAGRLLRQARENGKFTPSEESVLLIPKIKDKVPERARDIIDVYA